MMLRLIPHALGAAMLAATLRACGPVVVEPGACDDCATSNDQSGITTRPPATPLADADEAAACTRFDAVRGAQTQMTPWSAGAAACELGSLPASTRQASLEWVNYYRALVGLAPLSEDVSERTPAQACALILERNGQLSHTPPLTWVCASAMACDAVARSNLSGNPGFPMSPWYAVRGWIDEGRDLSNTLGHRRWIFSPELRSMSYGQTGSFACMTLGLGPRDPRAPEWIAWPPAGWVPTGVMSVIWSFSRAGVGAAGTQVQVWRDGALQPTAMVVRRAGFGDDTVSWDMPDVAAGRTYRVRVSMPSVSAVEYEVRPTSCSHQVQADPPRAAPARAVGDRG
jgi:hypothetical protein